ncbi:Hypothetical protein, putative [Bodo saltans]|uniref:Autophagy protein ATG5 UblA domain-containing protein n=1 Tax=Bodo saltans TaxID=75058 RepID=A0A0S4J2I2_BODSA|nr:Hypothetical protein, putative [Bodo saltans]|eukprot:CUG60003.1 Hypothetical protein, putative [Bodo saltans]
MADSIGCVPLVIGLCPRDNHREDAVPEPLVLLLPRSSYLMSVAHLVREAFAAFVPTIGKPLAVWLCRGGGGNNNNSGVERPLPWHYPIGVLFDLLSPSSSSNFNSQSSSSPQTARPLFLTARMTPVVEESPSDVPLCVIGTGRLDPHSGTEDNASSPAFSVDDSKREKREVQHAVSVFIRQCLKASLASSFGTTRHYFTLDPASSEALSNALVATDEEFLLEGGLTRFRKSREALLKQATVTHPTKYLIAVYDAQLDSIAPKMTTVSAAQVHSTDVSSSGSGGGGHGDQKDVFTFAHLLAMAAANLGGSDVFFSLATITTSVASVGSPSSTEGHLPLLSRGEVDLMLDEFHDSRARRMEKDGGRLLILVDGIEIPMKAPASLVLKHFLGYDYRLHIVLAKKPIE